MSWTELVAYRSTVNNQYDDKTGQTTGYDNNGNITYRKTDSDGNGTNEEEIFYFNDANHQKVVQYENETGRILSNESYLDGKCYHSESFEYDENGNTSRMNIDSNGDGRADYIIDYTYDDEGNATRKEQDVRTPGEKIIAAFKNLF